LADAVTFGVLPGIIAYQMLNGLQGAYFTPFVERTVSQHLVSSIALFIPACSVLRLAKFNIDMLQSYGFLGLPTPAMSIFIASIPVIAEWQYEYNIYVNLSQTQLNGLANLYHYDAFDLGVIQLFSSYSFWWVVCISLALLMVSEVPIIALKFKSFAWKENRWKFIFLIAAISTIILSFIDNLYYTGLLPWIQFLCIPIVIVELVLVSIVAQFFKAPK
jgi:CDP-diacylglycerol--serine O-phosphatidyltransferase